MFFIQVFSIRLFSHFIPIKFPIVSALSLSSSVLSFAVHAFRTVSWFIFLSFDVPFILILLCCPSFPEFIAIRNSPDEIRRIPGKCTDFFGVLCRQWLRHIWPVASDGARFARSECWVRYRNFSKTSVRGRSLLAAVGVVLVIVVRSAVRVSSRICCEIV
jgi:hypothetical protein